MNYKTGIVVFNNGAFGGAAKRYTNLFIYLDKLYPGAFYYIVNSHLFNQIHEIYPAINTANIRIIDSGKTAKSTYAETSSTPRFYKDTIPDPDEVDKKTFLPRKIYWHYKNRYTHHSLFKKIEFYRQELGINVFYGVFAGILPLVFYLKTNPRKASVVFSDMDSWFSDVHKDMEKLWYRRYYSFNYALENCDIIDFLSPYILEGVKKLGVKVRKESIAISPCSFADYSSCTAGVKDKIEIAFCSRLEPDKNPMLYLEAAKEILKNHPEAKFHLLGEGSLVNEIKEYIDTNKLNSSINFTFHKNPPEVFKNTSIFISLQKNTNYPSQSVLEAMACGNAIIASGTGDTNLFINKEKGIIVDLSLKSLTGAIKQLVTNRALTLKLGENARSFALANHTVEKFTEYFLSILDKAYRMHF